MTKNPSYAPGTPLWVDFATSDLPGSTNFYSQLFGWEAEDLGEQAGHYTMMRKGGLMVAAITPQMNPQAPPSWTTYVATTDANKTAEKAKQSGGQVVMDPFQVMDSGTMAGFIDPAGAFVCAWQPDQHKGAELVNEPGAFCWNELQTRDMARAKPFYTGTFGWGIKDSDMGGASYTEWQVDGKSIAGGMTMSDQVPAQVPSFWLTYFAVEDIEAAVNKIQQLGGSVMMPAVDSPVGRFAVVGDQLGAGFAVIKLQS